jgi:hypothetical protein
MTEDETVSGFERPRPPLDEWTGRLYEKHGLGESPSLEKIEPVATELLSNPLTSIEGAELVLGRRVDGSPDKEPEVLPLIMTPGFSGEDKFGLLLMQKQVEESKAAK